MENLSVIISVSVALAAIVSPILTAIINNWYQTKIKKMELENNHYENTILYRRNIFGNYLRAAGHYIGSKFKDYEGEKKYNDAYLAILLYVPDDLKSHLIDANNFIIKKDLQQSISAFEFVASKIRDHLNSL